MGAEILKFDHYINGQWLKPDNGETLEVLNPSNDEVVGLIAKGNKKDAEVALKAAETAQKDWAKVPARKRAELLYALIDQIKANREEIATVLTKEQGKLFKVAQFEVDVCCSFIQYACEWARRIEGDIVPSDNENEQIWIQKVPRGVIVAITAWNFPLALAGRKLGPALVAGNSIVIKATDETPMSTLMLGELAKKAGIPDGLINIVTGPGREIGDALVRNPITKMVTMTGSTPTGQAIIKAASDNMAHVQLELGGKAPFIAFEDADIDEAVEGALHSRFDNCGQVCTCNERMYIHEDIYDEFMEKFMAKVKGIKVGDPFDPTSDMGAKVNKSELKHMQELVDVAVKEGATLAYGGKKPEGAGFEKGNWFMPTVLTDVKQDMTIVHEEAFGPILPVLKFKDFDEVVGYANDCEFGLAAMVYTNDMNRIMKLNQELEFGEIYINRGHGELHQGFHNGYKMSGTGGEDGKYGFEQYLEKKTFYVRFKV
ncbi:MULTISPECIES: aldehyde dehydrogenase [unclassified Saccharicrinis]|uniref:aldehyde dehydrogenase n=1 Tax=unclassified Saccharicrinis TaxID=2646859 RepID=UPI003D33D620